MPLISLLVSSPRPKEFPLLVSEQVYSELGARMAVHRNRSQRKERGLTPLWSEGESCGQLSTAKPPGKDDENQPVHFGRFAQPRGPGSSLPFAGHTVVDVREGHRRYKGESTLDIIIPTPKWLMNDSVALSRFATSGAGLAFLPTLKARASSTAANWFAYLTYNSWALPQVSSGQRVDTRPTSARSLTMSSQR